MRAMTSLREALADTRLLGKALPGESWHAWRVVLMACMGEPLTADELATFREVTGRETAPTERCDELVAVIGRRGGKSRAIGVLAVYLATLADYSDVLTTGERGVLLCVAPDIKQAGIVRGYVSGVLQDSELLAPLLQNETRWEINLTNGIDIETRAANFRRIRGATCIAAIADEACYWYADESGSANPDTEILNAIRPSLATTKGLLAIISTPYARRGATWEAYNRHYGPQGDPAILVAAGASRTFNPSLPQSVIDRAYERDAEAARAEYGGEWRTDIAAFVSREAVQACVDTGQYERPYSGTARYFAHADPSGGASDSFTLAISHREGDRAVLDVVREVRPPFSPESVVQEFAATLKDYRIKKISGDRYAGEWPRDSFRRHGITYRVCDHTASELFLEMLPLINAGTARLLDSRRLTDQLINLERRTAFGTGRDVVGHAPRQHDDVAVAAAGALVAAAKPEQRCRVGAHGYGGGKINWHGEEQPRPRIRIVRIPEADAPAVTNRGWTQ